MKKLINIRLLLIIPLLASVLLIVAAKTKSLNIEEKIEFYEEFACDCGYANQEENDIYEPEWQSYTIMQGDNFSSIASKHLGLNSSETLKVTEQAKKTINLSQLKTGKTIQYLLNKEGLLEQLRIPVQPNVELVIQRQESDFTGQTLQKSLTTTHQLFKGVISKSLTHSMQAQGAPHALAYKAGILLEKKHNLRRDLRAGDKFELLISSDEVNGELFSPQIEAIRINGNRLKIALYRHSDDCYYDEDGRSLDPGFNRNPLVQTYKVSSPFNLNRMHPLTGQICPHHGTDFASPVGTPVISPADGKVKGTGYQQFAGTYLIIEHYNGYITRYFHLSKLFVKKGDLIPRGHKIALTGNSGRTTGAHLHYELHKNGRPVDAMVTNLPLSKNLHGKALAIFKEQILQKVALLGGNRTQLAFSKTHGREPHG